MAIRDFLSNLGEGLSEAAGAPGAAERFSEPRRRRQALSDLELETQTQQILGDVQGLHERRSKLDPNSPTYQQDIQTIDQALHDARQVFTGLYHPENNPGALAKFGGFLKSHLGKRKQGAATPAEAKQSLSQRMGAIESAAYAPTPEKNKFLEMRRQLKEAGVSDENIEKAIGVAGGYEARPGTERTPYKEYVSPDGKQRQWFKTDEAPEGWQATGGAGSAGNKLTGTELTLEAYESAFDPPRKWAEMTPEQRAFFPQWKAMQSAATTAGQSVMMERQKDGSDIPIVIQKTSEKSFPGAEYPPGFRNAHAPGSHPVAKTPAEARQIVPKPQAGVVSVGKTPIGGRLTAPQSAAQKEYDEAKGLTKNVKDIQASMDSGENTALMQKQVLVALERLRAGRFTQQAVTYIVKAGWGNSIEQWANNVTTGQLPSDVWRQVVQSVKNYEDEKKTVLETSGINVAPDTQQQLLDEINKKFPKKPK